MTARNSLRPGGVKPFVTVRDHLIATLYDVWVQNRNHLQIPEEWEMWRGADDGFAAPACVLWLARDHIHDRIYVVQELYRSGMIPDVMARAVLQIDGKRELDGTISARSKQSRV